MVCTYNEAYLVDLMTTEIKQTFAWNSKVTSQSLVEGQKMAVSFEDGSLRILSDQFVEITKIKTNKSPSDPNQLKSLVCGLTDGIIVTANDKKLTYYGEIISKPAKPGCSCCTLY